MTIQPAKILPMDVRVRLHEIDFVWNRAKAASNVVKHDGITFEQATEVFCDPMLRIVDASRNGESRDAVIGFDTSCCLLFVVHVQVADDAIRIISARKATPSERKWYEHS